KRFRLSKRKRGGQRKTEVPPKQTAQEGIRAGANKAASARPRATSSLTFVWWSGGVLLVALLVAGAWFWRTHQESSASVVQAALAFVGSGACAQCHAKEQQEWSGSQHDQAMQHADDKTVLGRFDGARFTHSGIISTFLRRDGRFFVNTDGADGKLADFEVKYTFGVYPLQQYLVEFPDGRLQALSLAWDSRPREQGGQRWFHLYPNERIDHRDVLHWTRPSQNWNHMCSECHSTHVQKNYDPAADRFHTSYAEISVG